MKETFYFPHDYNAMQDEKIKMLIRKHGMEGYGIFWAIVEMLYNNANALRTDYEGIAFDVRTNCEKIESIVNDFDLFIVNGDTFGSMSIERRLNERKEKSRKAKESASYRWNNANALRTECDGNAIKEKKVKEKKEKKEIKETISKDIAQKKVDAKASTLTRRDEFYKSLIPFLSTYGKDMIRDFFDYWSEQNKSGTQMRFEKQPTWEVAKRLATWNKRDTFKNQNNGNTKIQSTSSREAKEQSRRNLVKLADQILGIDESEDNSRSFR